VLAVGADVIEASHCLRKLAALMNGADPLEREVIRARAIRELERAGVTPPARMVDAALPRPTTDAAQEAQGAAIVFKDVEPWPEPVDGADILAGLVRVNARHVVLPKGAATAIALWIVHAHALDVAEVSPILGITSPEKRCAKTTELEVIGALVPRPLPAANITAASLFRAVDLYRPTLLVDEADSFLAGSDELRGIVNSGHRRASAFVVRCVGDDHEPRTFRTWGAKAVACIGALPGTLEDRAILVRMRRRRRDESVTPLRLDRLDAFEPLRRQAARWAADHLDALRVADPDVPPQLHDRAADNWRPLLAIADAAAGPWPERARRAAVLLSAVGEGDGAPAEVLLADIRALFAERGADRLPSEDIVAALVKLEDRPWPEWKHGKPLTVRQLARLLSRFDVGPKDYRFERGTLKGYELAKFADAFGRYLPSDPQQPQQGLSGAVSEPSANRNTGTRVADGESADNPRRASHVAGVAGRDDGRAAAHRADERDPDEEARRAQQEGA
jgi:putative DNA primase/helicase